MTIRLKICGLFRLADADAVNHAQPDYVGFVFAPSRRQVSEETAAELRRRIDPGITTVGVFTRDNTPETILRLAQNGVISIAQLHGDWPDKEVARLRKRNGLRLIRAVSIRSEADFAQVEKIAKDERGGYLLLDGPAPGSGQTFDWRLLKGRRFQIPFFLAGGIMEENLHEAMAVGPFGIDLSGGAETNGLKDPNKIIDITRRVHGAKEKKEVS